MKKDLLTTLIVLGFMFTEAKDPANVTANVSLSQNRAPLAFMENKGQVMDQDRQPRPDIQFSIKAAPGLNIFIGSGAIHYQFSKADSADKGSSTTQGAHLPLRPLQREIIDGLGKTNEEKYPHITNGKGERLDFDFEGIYIHELNGHITKTSFQAIKEASDLWWAAQKILSPVRVHTFKAAS